MPIRLFQGPPGPPGLFGRRGFNGRKKWGPPRFGRRLGRPPLPGGGVPPFPPEGPWAEPFGPNPELFGPPGPWVEDLWEMPPGPFGFGPWGGFPGMEEDF